MKNPPGANKSRIKGEQKAGFSTLSGGPRFARARQATQGDGLSHEGW
jgi:hypothetical protein